MKRAAFYLLPFTLILVSIFVSCQSEAEIEYKRYFVRGMDIYKSQCQNCHGESGEGLGALIPPLAKADYLHKNESNVPCVIQNGLQSLIMVNGKLYHGKMPSQSQLSPIEIAEVVTFVRNSFGNAQGLYNVDMANRDLAVCSSAE